MSERERAMEQGSTGLGEGIPRPRERKGAASPIYSVELEVFEGPLDLLLHLVRKHELDILDIPIAFVAEKYLEYLDVMRQLDLEIAGDYLVMAATLAYLKSRELLPPEPRSGEAGQSEEEEGEDPREALIRRLVEYERFKQAAAELDSLPVSGRDVFARGAELVMPPIDPGLAPVSLFNLAEAYYRVLTRAKVKSTHEVQIEAVTVAQRIKQLALILDEKPHFEFEELFLNRTWNSERELRAMLVVTLMSILEMVKLGVAGVQQPLDSPTIRIYRRASAEQTQQALADYDEDASFGAPQDKEGEPTAPPSPTRASEADLDAVEEAALLAEALASVQEPEEPVVGYADEGEDVAANDPAGEYDDEPRPPDRRSRSERRASRQDDPEDRQDEPADDADSRLVIVAGATAEVARERDAPRRGRRPDPAALADEEAASPAPKPDEAIASEATARTEDVLEPDAAAAGEGAARTEGVLEDTSRDSDEAAASEAAARTEDVLEDMSRSGDLAATVGGAPDREDARATGASEAADGAEAGAEPPEGGDVREDTSGGLMDAEGDGSPRSAEAEVLGDSPEPGEVEAAQSTDEAASGGFEELSVDGESEAAEPASAAAAGSSVDEPTAAAEDVVAEGVPGDSSEAGGLEATDLLRTAEEAAEDAPGHSSEAGGSAAAGATSAVEDEAAEGVLVHGSEAGGNAGSERPDEVARDVSGDSSAADESESTRPTSAAQNAAAEGDFGDPAAGGVEAPEPADEAAEGVLGDSSEALVSSAPESTDEPAEDVSGDISAAGDAEAAEATTAAGGAVLEAVLGDSAEAGRSEAADGATREVFADTRSAEPDEGSEPATAAHDEAVGDPAVDGPESGGFEAAGSIRTIAEGDLGDCSTAAIGGGAVLTAAAGVSERSSAAGEIEAGESSVVAESAGVLAGEARGDGQGRGEVGDGLAGADGAARSAEEESEPVRSDSDEDEAGGLFLNTGEGLGARELGDVDEDEGDAQ